MAWSQPSDNTGPCLYFQYSRKQSDHAREHLNRNKLLTFKLWYYSYCIVLTGYSQLTTQYIYVSLTQ